MQTHHWVMIVVVAAVAYVLGNMQLLGNWGSKVGMS